MINLSSFIMETLKTSSTVSDSERTKVKHLLDEVISDVKKSNDVFG